jgi:two-component system NarL family response regulator
MKKIRLLLIEDNRLLRERISATLSKVPEFKVVAALDSGERLLEELSTHTPDVVLLEPATGTNDLVRLVESVTLQFPKTKIIILDLVPEQTDILGCVRAGATGFLLKNSTENDIVDAVRAVAGGTTALPPGLTAPLFGQILRDSMNGHESGSPRLSDSVVITKREREVILLIAEALTNKEIAERLHLSTTTIKSHVHIILEKLTLHTRIHIAQYARDHESFRNPKTPAPPDGE